jgi:protein disulfide-isomerase
MVSIPFRFMISDIKNRYVNGKSVDTYGMMDNRDLKSLEKYIDGRMAPAATKTEDSDSSTAKLKPQVSAGPPANPSGTSLPLTAETFSQHISLVPSKANGAGWFVKFYVPWCSHCQHMAEAWTELAREMKGKLNIAEVNCDAESKLCKDIKLRGYPTLIFFKGGERVEYDGLRGLGDLVSFAGKAVQYGPINTNR